MVGVSARVVNRALATYDQMKAARKKGVTMDLPLIVHERSGRWAVAIRAAMQQQPPKAQHARGDDLGQKLVETRSVDECLAALMTTPRACVAVELTLTGAAVTWELLARISRDFPAAHSLVLADRGLSAWEWGARELGAVHLVDSPRRAEEVLLVAARHARQLLQPYAWQNEGPDTRGGNARRVWWQQAPLPWSDGELE